MIKVVLLFLMFLSFDDDHMMCNQCKEVTRLLVDKVFNLFWLVV